MSNLVSLSLSLRKKQNYKLGPKPLKTLRLWNWALECNKESTSTEREEREKEWERRETETVKNDVGAKGLLL